MNDYWQKVWDEKYTDLVMAGRDPDEAECDASDYVEEMMEEDKLCRSDYEYENWMEK